MRNPTIEANRVSDERSLNVRRQRPLLQIDLAPVHELM
jgi:hypothetical protein